jgi:hypothetical protein
MRSPRYMPKHKTAELAQAFLAAPAKPLTEDDAINIWIARWIRVRPSELTKRYGCDPRRLYEIWEEAKFPGTRSKALAEFARRYPGVNERIDPGPHRRVSKAPHPDQMSLFSEA